MAPPGKDSNPAHTRQTGQIMGPKFANLTAEETFARRAVAHLILPLFLFAQDAAEVNDQVHRIRAPLGGKMRQLAAAETRGRS